MKTRRLRWLMDWLLLAVALLMPNPSGGAWAQTSVKTSKPAQGVGSSENPFIISSAQELAWFRDWVNGTYTTEDETEANVHPSACAKISDQVEEIDLSTLCGESIGSWESIGKEYGRQFMGQFDGNHKTIKNLYINETDLGHGFFGMIDRGNELESYVKDLYFENATIIINNGNNTEPRDIGVLAGYVEECNISNVHILSGTVKGDNAVGGLIGAICDSKIYDCTNHANISGKECCGGLVGTTLNCNIERCANYGAILTEGPTAGGIAGEGYDLTIKDCANLGNVKARNEAGGIAGALLKNQTGSFLQNVYTCGDVETTEENKEAAGLVCCYAKDASMVGQVIYNTSAKLNDQAVNNRPFGIVPSDGSQATGLSQELIKSGYAAYLLQQGAGEDGVWGQLLGTDDHPMLGSTHTVYADNMTISCTGTINQGSFTNEQPASGSQLSVTHGSATYHPAVAVSCIADGSVAYYECSDCHKAYRDEQFTEQLYITTIFTHGHEYANGKCSSCQKPILTIAEGTHAIHIEDVWENKSYPGSYNLYKYVATRTSTLTVYTTGEEDTTGGLWNSDLTEKLAYNDDDEDSNFKFTYEVEKGKTYYIGVRSYAGYAIDGDYQLTIELEVEDGAEVLVGTLDGKNIIGTKQGNDYIVANLDLADGKQLMLQKDNVQLQGGSYTRNFQNNKWQPLYVPFELEVTENLLNDFELAAPNNLHEYELADGTTKVSLEAKKMKSGNTIKALRPYLIRAKKAGDKAIQLSGCTLKASSEDTFVSCSSVLRLYKFIGTLKGKTTFDPSADFVLSEGIFYPADANAQLKPMRWYLNAIDSGTDMGIGGSTSSDTGSEGDTSIFSRSIDITIVDGDPTTGIDDIHVITEQADGSTSAGNLSAGTRRGIYDLQGRKLSKEPKSGIYIKDGKKMGR